MFKIGFLPVRIWDILDVLIVGYLMYTIYRLLRGNIAFNIFVGVLTMYVVWWLVNQLNMDLLGAVLDQFVKVGVIVLIIIFQPEVRRFLLFLGKSTLRQRSKFLDRIIDRSFEEGEFKEQQINAIRKALIRLARSKTGALIVFSKNLDLEGIINPGVQLDANIHESLLESIFNKESPLHDGAIIMENGKIKYARTILPVSESQQLPGNVGLRHRAAVGITEKASVAAFVVSEETGVVSFAYEGKLRRKLTEDELTVLLNQHLA